MSAQSFSNLNNSVVNGDLILSNGYLQFPDGSVQTTASGGGTGTGVYINQNNTFQDTYIQTFDNGLIVNNSNSITFQNITNPATTQISQNLNNLQIASSAFGAGIELINTNTTTEVVLSTNQYGLQIDKGITIENDNGNGNSVLLLSDSIINNQLDVSGNLSTSGDFYLNGLLLSKDVNTTGLKINNDGLTLGNTTNDNYVILQSDTITSNQLDITGSLNTTGIINLNGNSLNFGTGVASSTYTIYGSGDNSSVAINTDDNTGTTRTTISASYDETIFYSQVNTFEESIVCNDVGVYKSNSDPSFSNQNATIYWNSTNTIPTTQQLRVNLGGTIYYINLTPV